LTTVGLFFNYFHVIREKKDVFRGFLRFW
jgi:hypothetical protein